MKLIYDTADDSPVSIGNYKDDYNPPPGLEIEEYIGYIEPDIGIIREILQPREIELYSRKEAGILERVADYDNKKQEVERVSKTIDKSSFLLEYEKQQNKAVWLAEKVAIIASKILTVEETER